jgi:hypothetical protein
VCGLFIVYLTWHLDLDYRSHPPDLNIRSHSPVSR